MRGMKRRQLRGFDLKQINGVASLIGVDIRQFGIFEPEKSEASYR